ATIAGQSQLLLVDRMQRVTVGQATLLQTAGRDLPGATGAGEYAVVSTHDPLVFATGVANGPDTLVAVDGLPFSFLTRGPNGRFVIPIRPNQAFTVRFRTTAGVVRGTATGQAPASGTIDLGDPLDHSGVPLTVRGDPGDRSVVDITTPITLRFSEPVDAGTVSNGLVVTDEGGTRIFGGLSVSDGGLTATFSPARRWRFATTYRYGLATSVLARSG